MTIVWAKILPVIISIIVLIIIALLNESSRVLSAIFATMPLTAPLSAWIIYSNSNNDQETLVTYHDSMFLGFLATLAYLGGAWLAARSGQGLWGTTLIGYSTWGIVLIIAFGLRRLLGH